MSFDKDFDKDFAPYQESLDMKELGFDEPCFGYYYNRELSFGARTSYGEVVEAPTFSQCFRWFRDKHKLKADVTHATSNGGYTYTIWKWNFDNNVGKWERIGVINSWFTYEEAELECLKKLIQIIKEKTT